MTLSSEARVGEAAAAAPVEKKYSLWLAVNLSSEQLLRLLRLLRKLVDWQCKALCTGSAGGVHCAQGVQQGTAS